MMSVNKEARVAKVAYGMAYVYPERCVQIYMPPLTWRQKWLRFKDGAITVLLLAGMFFSWAISLAAIFSMF